MPDVSPELLAESRRGSVIAPAGCGKTEIIARAVALSAHGRSLVLTHTHSGVRAIKDRFNRLGVSREKYLVTTIASFCLKYAASYPKSSGLVVFEPSGGDWDSVYSCAASLLKIDAIRRVVVATYSSVFVDEYQDCTRDQHDLIIKLAEVLPTRVLGDPLQGIFAFAGGILNWKADVETAFPPMGELSIPWRWKDKNAELGEWLMQVRDPLFYGRAIDLRGSPVQWMPLTEANQRNSAFSLTKRPGRSVVVHKWPREAHLNARNLRGVFRSMEEIDCNALVELAQDIDSMSGTLLAARLLRFGNDCFAQLSDETRTVLKSLDEGKTPDPARAGKTSALRGSLAMLVAEKRPEWIRLAMTRLEDLAPIPPYRHELWEEAKRMVLDFHKGGQETYRATAWAVRNRTRFAGRSVDPRVVSRTLLIKGLEFEHALISDALKFENPKMPGDGAKHFYVAATRGSTSLSILSESPILQFSAVLASPPQ